MNMQQHEKDRHTPAPRSTAGAEHPLASCGLDMLARGAARLRGSRLAISEAGAGAISNALTYSELDQMISAFAVGILVCGLSPNDRILVLGSSRIGSIIAILGALKAGIEPVVAPIHMSAGALAFLAQSTGATALFGPTAFGLLDTETLMLEAVASAPDIRILGALGPGAADGAIDFSPKNLMALDVAAMGKSMSRSMESSAGRAMARPARSALPRIGIVQRGDGRAPSVLFMSQNAITTQALDIANQIGLSPERPLISTLSLANPLGLLAGPVASMLTGAPFTLFAPFDATGFVLLLDRLGPCHLVAPETILGLLKDAGVVDAGVLESLTLSCTDNVMELPMNHSAALPIIRLSVNAEGRVLRM